MNPIFGLSSSKNSAVDRDIVCVQVSTNKCICTSQIPHLVAFVSNDLLCEEPQLEPKKEMLNPFVRVCSQQPALSPEKSTWEDQAAIDSTTTLLHTCYTKNASRMEGTTLHISMWNLIFYSCVNERHCVPFSVFMTVFLSSRCNLQFRSGRQFQLSRVMLGIPD